MNLESEKKAVELNLNDLASIKNLIEIVTARGAFKAAELSSAGMLFDKLSAFLEAAQSVQAQQTEQTEENEGA